MRYWQIAYEMCIESAYSKLTRTIVDIVIADSYFEVINESLRESVEKTTESMVDGPEGHLTIEVDVIEVKQLSNNKISMVS